MRLGFVPSSPQTNSGSSSHGYWARLVPGHDWFQGAVGSRARLVPGPPLLTVRSAPELLEKHLRSIVYDDAARFEHGPMRPTVSTCLPAAHPDAFRTSSTCGDHSLMTGPQLPPPRLKCEATIPADGPRENTALGRIGTAVNGENDHGSLVEVSTFGWGWV